MVLSPLRYLHIGQPVLFGIVKTCTLISPGANDRIFVAEAGIVTIRVDKQYSSIVQTNV